MRPLEWVFSEVCSRSRCWAPGGETLPFCQRCTGLYVGAAVAVALYLVFRPRPTNASLWIYGLLLLAMVPPGYHLVPQNGLLRTLTGQLFAVGLVGYLSLLPSAALPTRRRYNLRAYAWGTVASILVVQVAVHAGGRVTGAILAWLGVIGLAVLALLAAVNLILLGQVFLGMALRAARRARARLQ